MPTPKLSVGQPSRGRNRPETSAHLRAVHRHSERLPSKAKSRTIKHVEYKQRRESWHENTNWKLLVIWLSNDIKASNGIYWQSYWRLDCLARSVQEQRRLTLMIFDFLAPSVGCVLCSGCGHHTDRIYNVLQHSRPPHITATTRTRQSSASTGPHDRHKGTHR